MSGTQPERIFPIATAADWRRTLETGTYTNSTMGRTLEAVGDDTYPHVYGPIYRTAVVDVAPLGRPGST